MTKFSIQDKLFQAKASWKSLSLFLSKKSLALVRLRKIGKWPDRLNFSLENYLYQRTCDQEAII